MLNEYIARLNELLKEMEKKDARLSTVQLRRQIERNMRIGAPGSEEELHCAADRVPGLCPRCGRELPGESKHSRYIALGICDNCLIHEASLELMNNPLPFRLWHCCIQTPGQEKNAPVRQNEPQKKLYYCYGSTGANAVGVFENGGITVLRGSVVASQMKPGFARSDDSAARRRMLADGTIDREFCFTRDVHFSFPSAAAKVVLGSSANGWTAWKDENGVPLDQLRKKG